jgi:hypothetical protein
MAQCNHINVNKSDVCTSSRQIYPTNDYSELGVVIRDIKSSKYNQRRPELSE